ncbi:MAG: GGDEF and EAL domain-containing protein [Bacteroidales bacterium]|nr:GGDEF and EAL domain-containing protein [Lachnoclostridium sp.]MCM1384020.1 GGDEF and EAL domain-containing protein [Lachnoclostridium sp.]MCM1466476.1 GGDEF and EAL domain-containing protein [Bacteroidales bacterium]
MSDVFNNELFEAFASASDNVYIYVCDMKTDVSRWSKAAVDYFGLEGEYMKEAANVWAQHIHPDDLKIYLDDINGVFSGTKKYHDCQYRARNASGGYIWVECKGSVIRDAEGNPIIFAGLMTRIDGQSKYDSLTGLLTTQEMHHFDFASQSGVALLIGMDGFRKIISNYGYNIGDEILIKFSREISDLCKPGWKVLRFSGDEFLILAFSSNLQEVTEFYKEICRETDIMILEDGRKVGISVSAGGVFFPKDADTREDLINKLEHSLEYAKNTRRGSMAFFSEEIAVKHERGLILREDLKQCIKNDFKGFELFFQPFINPDAGTIAGCECLLRWKGERITDSYPMEFIKVLEDYGDIHEVGFWVMEQAMKQQAAWRDTYGELQVSFNVSYQQFLDDAFVEQAIACVEKYGANPKFIIIELTESCQVENPEELAAIFGRLREKGFKIALDDFGTAYASMEMLKWLPVDYIKVEHSFIRELAQPGHDIDYVIVDSLLEMCRRLGYYSIIEGVENGKVADIVGELNATLLQGYHYSRPVCRNDFEKLLDDDRKR